jgi:hypothetical protein
VVGCVAGELGLGDIVWGEWARIAVGGLERRGLGESDAGNVAVMHMEGDVPMKCPAVSSRAILGPIMSHTEHYRRHTLTSRNSMSSISLRNFFFTLPTTGTGSASFNTDVIVPLPLNFRSATLWSRT